jgi:hypothetical protein
MGRPKIEAKPSSSFSLNGKPASYADHPDVAPRTKAEVTRPNMCRPRLARPKSFAGDRCGGMRSGSRGRQR